MVLSLLFSLEDAGDALLLKGLADLLLKAADEAGATPGLGAELQDEEQQDIDAHEAPGAPGAHAADLVAPDLLLVVAGQDAGAEVVIEALRLALGLLELAGAVSDARLKLVVGAVEAGEALKVGGGPGLLAGQQGRHLALRGGPLVDPRLVGVAGLVQVLLSGGQGGLEVRDARLERLDARVAGQDVDALRGSEQRGLEAIHEGGKLVGHRGGGRGLRGQRGVGRNITGAGGLLAGGRI